MNDERRPSQNAAATSSLPNGSTGSGEVDRLMTAAELGEYLGLSASTVLDRWQAGDLPAYKLFGRNGPVRFRASEIEAFLADCHVEALG